MSTPIITDPSQLTPTTVTVGKHAADSPDTATTTTTTYTTPSRTIGPVTTASAGGAAASVIIGWGLSTFAHVYVPPEVQGSIAVVLVILAGWAVKPRV